MTPGKQIGCVLTPAAQSAFIMMIDAFVFSPTTSSTIGAGQSLFAQALRDPAVHVPLAQQMGAIPPNFAVSDAGFDNCSATALQVLREPHTHLLDPA